MSSYSITNIRDLSSYGVSPSSCFSCHVNLTEYTPVRAEDLHAAAASAGYVTQHMITSVIRPN